METTDNITEIKEGEVFVCGTYEENGIRYNRYGVCLDCNGGNAECDHRNLADRIEQPGTAAGNLGRIRS